MNLRVPLPEALDKYSILTLKMERLPDDQRKIIEKEFNFYKAVIDEYRKELDFKEEWIEKLHEINGRCWDLEAAIRSGKDGELSLEEIGRRTLVLRDYNKERIAQKNKVAEEIGLDFFEIKIDHASE